MVRHLHVDACEPVKLMRLQRTRKLQLGDHVAFAIEAAKIALSGSTNAGVDLDFVEAGLSCPVQRTAFEETIAEKTAGLTDAARLCRSWSPAPERFRSVLRGAWTDACSCPRFRLGRDFFLGFVGEDWCA